MGQGETAEREAVVDAWQLQPTERSADDEAQVTTVHAPVPHPSRQGHRLVLVAAGVQHRDERPLGDATGDGVVLAHLDHLQAHVAGDESQVVRDVVGKRGTEPPDGNDGDAHGGILGPYERSQSA